jgi:hypothetical protein
MFIRHAWIDGVTPKRNPVRLIFNAINVYTSTIFNEPLLLTCYACHCFFMPVHVCLILASV